MEEEEILISSVPRALDMKSKLFGFELSDLLLIFMTLALTNLLFGASEHRYTLVWGTSLSLAAFLFFVKRGRPDRYLEHAFQFLVSESEYFANMPDPCSHLTKRKKL